MVIYNISTADNDDPYETAADVTVITGEYPESQLMGQLMCYLTLCGAFELWRGAEGAPAV